VRKIGFLLGVCVSLLAACSGREGDAVSTGSAFESNPGAADLANECGVAPDGLSPTFVEIPSTKSPGVTLSVAVQGDPKNPPIVLVHGFPDFWCGWSRVIPRLAKDHFVVAPDLRGFHRSSKPSRIDDPADVSAYELPRFVEDMGDVVDFAFGKTNQRVSLVAHDVGGFIAWPFAHAAPDHLAGLMVIGTPHPQILDAFLHSLNPLLLPAKLKQLGMLAYIKDVQASDSFVKFGGDQGFRPLIDKLLTTFIVDPSSFPPVEQQAYVNVWQADTFKCGAKFYRANFTGASPPPGLTIPVPTTFVAPLHDGAILFPESADGLRALVLADVPLDVQTIDTGHFPQREKPDAVAALIGSFVAKNLDFAQRHVTR
jgi:pimeloyl-ACP methyl ester carboxylesterase